MMRPLYFWWRFFIRACILIAVGLAPGIGIPVVPSMASTFLINDGVQGKMIFWMALLLVGTELMWGMDLGVLSLAFLLTVLAMRIAQRGVSLPSLNREPHWRIVPLLRGFVFSVLATLVMMALSVLIEALIYGHSHVIVLAAAVYFPLGRVLSFTSISLLATITLLHWGDVPFRRPISFGT